MNIDVKTNEKLRIVKSRDVMIDKEYVSHGGIV